MEQKTIAIDGPSGAGKSTLAMRIAEEFGFIYVDTGAIYRTLGLAVQKAGVSPKDEEAVAAILPGIKIDMVYDSERRQRMLLDGRDVSDEIRTPKSSIYASDISALPKVREFLLEMQRDIAGRYDVVMDGRDIGTVVLPGAGLKIFLTAKVEVRAERRYIELLKNGIETTVEEVLKDMRYRDEQDSSRAAAPLRAAPDAVVADMTGLSFEESFELLADIIRERFGI